MSAIIEIPANERGRLRLFALDAQLGMEIAHSGVLDHLYLALGSDPLHDPDVQIVQLREIDDMGLAAFLQDAYGIEPDELARHTAVLNALNGTVALLRSGAFYGRSLRLIPTNKATLIATFTEPQPDWSAKPMPTTRPVRRSPRLARTRARQIGFTLFAAMMALIVLVALWLIT